MSSPELVYAQLAKKLTFAEAVLLALELCGSYTKTADESRCIYGVAPVTTVKQLRQALDSIGGYGKKSLARRALACAADESASAMESRTILALTAPYSEGGYAVVMPEINGRVELTNEEAHFLNRDHLKCDMLWRSKRFAIEYDSLEDHGKSKDLANTLDRRTVLNDKGFTVLTIAGSDIYSYSAFNEKASYVLKVLDVRRRQPSKAVIARRRALVRSLSEIDWV